MLWFTGIEFGKCQVSVTAAVACVTARWCNRILFVCPVRDAYAFFASSSYSTVACVYHSASIQSQCYILYGCTVSHRDLVLRFTSIEFAKCQCIVTAAVACVTARWRDKTHFVFRCFYQIQAIRNTDEYRPCPQNSCSCWDREAMFL